MIRLVIRVGGTSQYFHGYTYDAVLGRNKPCFGKYDTGMKIYEGEDRGKAEKRAMSAIRNIGSIGCDLFADLVIEEAVEPIPWEIPPEVPEPPAPEKPEGPPPLVPVPESESGGWEIIDGVGLRCAPPQMCRREWNGCFEYAVVMADGKRYFLPGDELLAWSRYCDERKAFICRRIRERRIREGKDPDGMDEWKENA